MDPILDPEQVSKWLDAHPEFLTEYLKKIQVRQRCDSILNEYFSLNSSPDHTRTTTSSNSSITAVSQSNNSAALISLSLINTSRRASHISTLIHNSRSSLGSGGGIIDSINNNMLQSTNKKLNPSLSEPNIIINPDEARSLLESNTIVSEINRNKFKQLGLYEKMYTLVKTLYQSLDLRITCKKILNTVSLLLDADRCSLFLVVDNNTTDEEKKFSVSQDEELTNSRGDRTRDENKNNSHNNKFLISVVFDAKSKSLSHKNSIGEEDMTKIPGSNMDEGEDEQIRIPYGVGIAGFVAATKQAVNIEDAYVDSRFNASIDQKTGYKTKSILCLPILNENGECIAVAEAINKLDDTWEMRADTDSDDKSGENQSGSVKSFTKEDEQTFSKFMPFISIAIRNSNLYAQSRKEAQTNKVLLELATIVFDESSSTVDNLVSRILFNSLYLLECEKCQIVLMNRNKTDTNVQAATRTRRRHSYNDINICFDRVYELTREELTSNGALSNGLVLLPKSPNFTSNSPEYGIIKTVLRTGDVSNIQNNENGIGNFDTSVKSLLCIPVINSENQTVAILFTINKIQNGPSSSSFFDGFSRQDVNVAQTFALFCGIGIQNIMMYEKVVQSMNRQQVALDVLSFHVSSNQEDVNRLLEENIPEPNDFGLRSFLFDEHTLDDIGTLKACISMFSDLGLIEQFKIPYEVLCRFFLTVKKNYRPVAYHNWRHGFNVMSTMYTMFTTGRYKELFNDLEIFALLIACICHDVDHRGTSNKFQIKIQSPLAKLYSTSTMEHHHFNQCIIILHNTSCNILTNLTPSQHSTAIDIVEKAILATDLSLHFKHFDKFLEKANSDNTNFENTEDKDLLMNILMTACDLSGATKSWECHYRLSNLVANEFFTEGDLEKEKFNREPIDLMNRNKSDQLPQMQIQFIQSVCLPLYDGLTKCNSRLRILAEMCEENVKEWKKLIIDNNNNISNQIMQ